MICGIVQDERYFAEQVEPHIDGEQVVFRGSVGPRQRAEVLGSAAVLVHPIHFDEPFGLSVVEAMACGTPVVAYPRGSMTEVIDAGVTGYLATDVESAAVAIEEAAALDRSVVRARAAARFGVDRMVDDYLEVYQTVLARQPAGGQFAAQGSEDVSDRHVGDPDTCIADSVGQPQQPVVDQAAAGIDDVGYVAVLLRGFRFQQRVLQPATRMLGSSRSSRSAPME